MRRLSNHIWMNLFSDLIAALLEAEDYSFIEWSNLPPAQVHDLTKILYLKDWLRQVHIHKIWELLRGGNL